MTELFSLNILDIDLIRDSAELKKQSRFLIPQFREGVVFG